MTASAPASSALADSHTAGDALERHILEALPFAVYAVDLDGRVTLASRGRAHPAMPADSVDVVDDRTVGTPIWEALSQIASRAEIDDAMSRLRSGHAPMIAWERPPASSDGRAFLVHVAPLVDGHTITGFVFSASDVTAAHRSHAALTESTAALAQPITLDRVLAEVAQQLRRATGCDAVAVALADDDLGDSSHLVQQIGFDVDHDQIEGILRSHWTRALRVHGAEGGPPSAILETVSQGVAITARMSAGATRGAVTAMFAAPDANHGHVDRELIVATIAMQGAIAIERVRLVERMAQRHRLDGIGEVAAGVAQELRNPLFGISSAAQLLRFRVRDDPVIERNVGRILREVERLNGLVTSLLEYGRRAPLRLATGDPDVVWEHVLAAQKGLLESRALVLRHDPATPREWCNLDAEQLAQAFESILTNAVDAAPAGSDLSLVSVSFSGGGWRCRLRNEGPPIAPDVLPRVFDLFFSTKPGGAGLGLALCQRIVEAHGGTVHIESTGDSGTTATIQLPPRADAE